MIIIHIYFIVNWVRAWGR